MRRHEIEPYYLPFRNDPKCVSMKTLADILFVILSIQEVGNYKRGNDYNEYEMPVLYPHIEREYVQGGFSGDEKSPFVLGKQVKLS